MNETEIRIEPWMHKAAQEIVYGWLDCLLIDFDKGGGDSARNAKVAEVEKIIAKHSQEAR